MSSFKKLGVVFVSFLIYFFAAKMGLELATINKQASPIWPATGIGIGLVFCFGPRAAWGIFLGAFLSNFATGLSLAATIAIAVGNTLESVVFVEIFRRFILRNHDEEMHNRALKGILAMALSTLISALVGTFALWITSVIPRELVLNNFSTWWIGDFLGALFFAPIFYQCQQTKLSCFQLNRDQAIKLLISSLAAAVVCYFVFSFEWGLPFLFLIFLPILLVANWLDSVWVYLLALGICIYAVLKTVGGQGPFTGSELNDSLVYLQVFLAGLSITAIGLASIKKIGLYSRTNIALLCSWTLAGGAFFFSFSATNSRDQSYFAEITLQSQLAIESRMHGYVQMLESGVSFFNASEYVSKQEWKLFTDRLLASHRDLGIEGLGVIFSTSIKDRFSDTASPVLRYQPPGRLKTLSNVSPDHLNENPEDNLVITYIEPLEANREALGLNISSEKNRYQAAIQARDTGLPTITEKIQLVQDRQSRPGFLLYLPIYKTGTVNQSIEERRAHFVGLIYAPIIFEKFLSAAMLPFEGQIYLRFSDVYSSPQFNATQGKEVSGSSILAGKKMGLSWKRGKDFKSSSSLFSAWIGFFGTVASLFLAIMLSSLQGIAFRAEKLAKEMSREAKEKQRTWQAMTETSPVGIYLTDKDGSCTYVNSAWSQMTGLSFSEAAGGGWMKALHPEDINSVGAQWTQLVQGGKFDLRYRFIKADGQIFHVTGQAVALKDEKQEVTGYLGTVLDISELHQSQMAMITSSRMSSLGQMASGIAHEINNPLAIIQGRAFTLAKALDTQGPMAVDNVKEGLQLIQATVQRIAKIIRGLRTFARETTSAPAEVSFLNEIFQDTLELCQERFYHFSTQLVVPKEIGPEYCFLGHSVQISQVLLNLLNNAFDATSGLEDRWVKVELKKENQLISIIVSDSGKGVGHSLAAKIFDPFFTTKEVGKGTGLGLSISRGIVEQHQGRLYLDESQSQTTFVVELPAIENAKNLGAA